LEFAVETRDLASLPTVSPIMNYALIDLHTRPCVSTSVFANYELCIMNYALY